MLSGVLQEPTWTRVLHCSGRRLVYCFLLHVHDSWHLTVGHALDGGQRCARRAHMDMWGVAGLVVLLSTEAVSFSMCTSQCRRYLMTRRCYCMEEFKP